MPRRVSFTMIVKNEEANLPTCLGSVADLVDEIVVVDTGSSDRTKEVAAGYGARVFDFPWCDDFAAARNAGLDHATGDWVFWLDADDRLDEENRRKLRALLAGLGGENVAYLMGCLSVFGESVEWGNFIVQARLFRRQPDLRWKYRIHEQILPALRRQGAEVRPTDIRIYHVGYQDADLMQRKDERNLRLLLLEDAEHPDDPFVLYNLGRTYMDLRRPAEALPFLLKSVERALPNDSFGPHLCDQLAQCYRWLGKKDEALAACRRGLTCFPDDVDLRFQEAIWLFERGDLAGAEVRLLRLLQQPKQPLWVKLDRGRDSYAARHNLAVIYRKQRRTAEAEAQWRAAVAEKPDYLLGWIALGDLYLAEGRSGELEQTIQRLEAAPGRSLEAAVLRARWHLARKEFAAARALLEEAVARAPRDALPRLLLCDALVQERGDWAAAEKVLRDGLTLRPWEVLLQRRLQALLKQQVRTAAGSIDACEKRSE